MERIEKCVYAITRKEHWRYLTLHWVFRKPFDNRLPGSPPALLFLVARTHFDFRQSGSLQQEASSIVKT
jgi:ubiquitin-protein ligase